MTLIQSKALSVAVLVRSSYYAYGLTYPTSLYYNAAIATLQALEYLGIPAEIVTDSIAQAELDEYGGLIAVRGDGNCWALTQGYAETTGNPVLWIYVRGGDAAMNTALGITDAGQSVAGDVGGAVTTYGTTGIMEDLVDSWGNLNSFTTRSFTLGGTTTWTQYIVNDADSMPYLFSGEFNSATYYIFAYAGSWVGAGTMGRYYVQLLLNYARLAMPSLIRFMPVPSAKDSALIIRADDVEDLDAKWLAFWALYPHSSSGAQAQLAQATADYIAAHCDDYLPHGYDHEDFTTLTYAQQVTLLEQINAAWTGRFGVRPYYYIMPYNKANDDTGQAMMDTDGRFYTTAVSLTGYPSTYYYRHHDNEATTWGAYYEAGTLADYVAQIIGQGRFVGSVIHHPYTQDLVTEIEPSCDYVIDQVLANASTMLSTWSEIADVQWAKRNATMDDTQIGFAVAVPAGLTLEYRNMPAGKTLKVGSRVLPRFGDRIIFPALAAGTYAYSLVDIADYAIPTAVAAGLALKDGSCDASSLMTYITIEGWTYDGTDATAVVTLSKGLGYSLLDSTGAVLISDIGAGASVTLTPGDYEIVPKAAPTPTVITSPYTFVAWMQQSATIEPCTSFSKGSPVYGTGVSVACIVSQKMQNVLGADGNEIASDISLTTEGTVSVSPYDRVTLADGTVRPVKTVQSVRSVSGAIVMKVIYL